MDILSIKGTSQYPEVRFDARIGLLEFSGNSLPEDAKGFYEPLFDWINNYLEMPKEETTLSFKMIYYNTPSSKIIFQILKKFELVHNQSSKVKVLWQYPDDDIDMKYAGIDYSESIKVPFEFIEYKE